jgi:hypothetical protein
LEKFYQIKMAITQALAQKYADLIDDGCLPQEIENFGSRNDVFYTGAHALRVPRKITPETIAALFKGDEIGRIFYEEGVSVPETHGIYCPNGTPFQVLGRLNIVTLDELTHAQKAEAIRQYTIERTSAEDCGFTFTDSSPERNYGFDPERNIGFLFDFDDCEVAA